MCTTTWIKTADGYELFFNRDELHTRQTGIAPQLYRQNGVRYLAPQDRDAGGTWLGVNEFGITICLLNYYDAHSPPLPNRKFTSRGHLVTSMMDLTHKNEFPSRLAQINLALYRPFVLLALFSGSEAQSFTWSGISCIREKAALPPFASSSCNVEAVIQHRTAAFRQLQTEKGALNPDHLLAFHESHFPKKGGSSVCMHRIDAATVSLSHIIVGSEEISIRYKAGAPCQQAFLPSLTLARTPELRSHAS